MGREIAMTVEERGYASIDDLTAVSLDEDDVELPDGSLVRVRALSRAEVLRIQKSARNGADADAAAIERMTLAAGMVRPRMTEAQAGAWQAATKAGDVIGRATAKIRELSGMDSDAPREAYKSDRGEPGS